MYYWSNARNQVKLVHILCGKAKHGHCKIIRLDSIWITFDQQRLSEYLPVVEECHYIDR